MRAQQQAQQQIEQDKQFRTTQRSQTPLSLQPGNDRQSTRLLVDESISEFEWARRTSKTWDMGQD